MLMLTPSLLPLAFLILRGLFFIIRFLAQWMNDIYRLRCPRLQAPYPREIAE